MARDYILLVLAIVWLLLTVVVVPWTAGLLIGVSMGPPTWLFAIWAGIAGLFIDEAAKPTPEA